jgi:hypothetical protein
MRPTSLTRHDQNNPVARAIDPVRILGSLLMAVAIKVVTRDVIGFGVFNGARTATVRLRASGATRRLRKLRTGLIAEIESARREVPTEALAPTEGEAK